jgi:hypothetical protein
MGVEVDVLKNACWLPVNMDGEPNFRDVEPFMNWAVDHGHLDNVITEEQFWDPSFLEAAKKFTED